MKKRARVEIVEAAEAGTFSLRVRCVRADGHADYWIDVKVAGDDWMPVRSATRRSASDTMSAIAAGIEIALGGR